MVKTIQVKDKLIKESVNGMSFFNLMDKLKLWYRLIFISYFIVIFVLYMVMNQMHKSVYFTVNILKSPLIS
jgi:hypothetical protein